MGYCNPSKMPDRQCTYSAFLYENDCQLRGVSSDSLGQNVALLLDNAIA